MQHRNRKIIQPSPCNIMQHLRQSLAATLPLSKPFVFLVILAIFWPLGLQRMQRYAT
jgi:hypothetical protein